MGPSRPDADGWRSSPTNKAPTRSRVAAAASKACAIVERARRRPPDRRSRNVLPDPNVPANPRVAGSSGGPVSGRDSPLSLALASLLYPRPARGHGFPRSQGPPEQLVAAQKLRTRQRDPGRGGRRPAPARTRSDLPRCPTASMTALEHRRAELCAKAIEAFGERPPLDLGMGRAPETETACRSPLWRPRDTAHAPPRPCAADRRSCPRGSYPGACRTSETPGNRRCSRSHGGRAGPQPRPQASASAPRATVITPSGTACGCGRCGCPRQRGPL
jgi:hypothetical protein